MVSRSSEDILGEIERLNARYLAQHGASFYIAADSTRTYFADGAQPTYYAGLQHMRRLLGDVTHDHVYLGYPFR